MAYSKWLTIEDNGDWLQAYDRKGRGFKIDRIDDYLLEHRWSVDESRGYVKSNWDKQMRVMHQIINNTPEGMFTDHINHDRTDNRRYNLRTVTRQQNQQNRKLSKNNGTGKSGIQKTNNNRWTITFSYTVDTYEEALAIRLEMENKYYKEYAGE